MSGPTENQLSYINRLATSAGRDIPYVADFDEAQRVIPELQAVAPIQQPTIGRIHVLCKESAIDYAKLKKEIGVETLSPARGATEAQGKRAVAWLEDQITQKRKVVVRKKPFRFTPPPLPPQEPEYLPIPAAITEDFTPVDRSRVPLSGRQVVLDLVPPEEIERLTYGVCPLTAHRTLLALWERGALVPLRACEGPYLRWKLSVGQRNVLGLMPPARSPWGSVKNRFANSHFWSRNYFVEYEEIADSEIVEVIGFEEVAA